MSYNAEYKAVVEASGTISKGIEPITEALSELASFLETITIRSEVVNTLKAVGKLYINLSVDTEKYTKQEEYEPVYNRTFDVVSGSLSLKLKMEDHNYADAA